MTVARALYTDTAFSSSTNPSSTEIAKIITAVYKHMYRTLGEAYAAYSASAEHSVIDTENAKDLVVGATNRICQQIRDLTSILPNQTRPPQYPGYKLDPHEKEDFLALKAPTVYFASREDEHLTETGDQS